MQQIREYVREVLVDFAKFVLFTNYIGNPIYRNPTILVDTYLKYRDKIKKIEMEKQCQDIGHSKKKNS